MTDPKEKKPPTIRTRPPGKIGGGMFDRVKLRSEPHPIEEIIAGRGLQPPPDSKTHPAGATSETGTTYLEGNTQTVGITSEQGITEAMGNTYLEGHTQSLGNTQPAGTTHSTGQTSEIGTTRRTGRTRAPRPSVRRATSPDTLPVSPERDFQKVPNSITREMATRIFRGKSLQLYNYLWSQSRGAIVPSRTLRRSRPQLLRGAGFGSMGTVERCVDFLVEVGLLKVRSIVGEAEGNEYEVFTPEEVGPALFGLPPSTGTTYETGTTGSTLKQVVPVVPETGSTGSTLSSNASEVSGGPKTSFKTEEQKLDDEAFAPLLRAMRGEVGRKLDRAALAELVEMLTTEFKIAEGRTGMVSSPAAFFLRHMRERLWKKDKGQLEREVKPEAKAPAAKTDSSKCPDCFGTGMWYPEGFEKGVARCRHEKLGVVD